MKETRDILKTVSKGKEMGTWEHLHIYKFSKQGLTINKQYTNQNNTPFELALNERKT
jgi:hypothetical protein